MKKYLFTIISALVCCSASAQSPQALLEKFVDRMTKDKGITMTADAAVATASSNGRETVGFSISGKRFRLDSNEFKIWFDGSTEWQGTPSDDGISEIYISQPPLDNLPDFLKKHDGFSVSGNGTSSFTLTADDPNGFSGICSATVTLSPATLNPLTVKVVTSSQVGWTVNVTVKEFKSGQELPDSHFRCNTADYPEAETIDLR